MNVGFSSLTKAKALLLPAATRTNPMWDDQIITLGLTVAELIEGHCARKLAWVEGDTFETEANRIVISVPRYPVIEWTALEMQTEPGATWEDVSDSILRYEAASGLLHFRTPPGDVSQTLRVTFMGGFYWDTTEDATGTAPEGAPALPNVFLSAWTLQMQAIAQAMDLFGAAAGKPQSKGNENTRLPLAELLPIVQTMINPYRRFAA